LHWISNLFLGEKTVRTALGGDPNSLGKLGGNQWDALRASHALGASVSFSTKLKGFSEAEIRAAQSAA